MNSGERRILSFIFQSHQIPESLRSEKEAVSQIEGFLINLARVSFG